MNENPDQPGTSPRLEGDRINSFALVSYIPDPLAAFLDKLRRELVPNCHLHAHVTVLPPRPLQAKAEAAWRQVREASAGFQPFEIALGAVEVFPVSDVIHIGLSAGGGQLRAMHNQLNRGCLAYPEPFAYHPHVTLAQELKPDQVDEFREVARRRWAEFTSGRAFRAERVTFVQNSRRNVWVDLGECHLGTRVSEVLEPTLA
jgi:2'-5' RNA ligase